MNSENFFDFLGGPIFFFITFPVFWCGIVLLLAYVSGWVSLAQVYHFSGVFQGQQWSFQSGKMGVVRYRGALTVGANREGLYLKPMFLFRLGQPPLFIPWHDISIRQGGFLLKYMEFQFQRAPSVRLKLYPNLVGRLAKAAGKAWPGEVDSFH